MENNKPNPAARINRLTRDQREIAFMHCELVSIKDGVQWLASEFHLQTSASSLSKWLRKQRADRSMAERREHLLLTKEKARIVGEVFETATEVTVANSVLISQAVFEEMEKVPENRDQKKLTELMRLALTARAQEIKESTLNFNIKRFKFNASKSALKHAKELQAINESNEDETEKIEKVILLLFGPEPTRFIDPPEKEGL